MNYQFFSALRSLCRHRNDAGRDVSYRFVVLDTRCPRGGDVWQDVPTEPRLRSSEEPTLEQPPLSSAFFASVG